MTTPPYLQKGDTIGLVCPAGFMPLEKVQTAINTLQEWGFTVKTGTTIGGGSTNYFSATDDERLNDLQVIFAGYGLSFQRVPYNDYAGIDVNGKAVLIFSHEPQEQNPNS